MADFLTDYSNLAGAGAAFKGFAEGYQNAQDNKMKRQEMQAKMDAMKADQDRAATESALKLRLADTQKNPLTGELEDRPPSLKEQNAQIIGTAEKGLNPIKYDSQGKAISPTWNPQSPQMIGANAKTKAASTSMDFKEQGLDLRRDVVDRREHQNVINKINSNPNVKQRLTQYQNLDNALSSITQSDKLTPQQIMEFQQSVRTNLGIKGSSGVGEREETYFKTAGLNAANWMQFITGNPAEIAKDSKLMNHFKQLATVEQGNISKQFDKSLSAASAGHASMYGRRPDLKDDLKDALNSQKEQMTPQSEAPPQQQTVPPQGMVQPQPKGMLSGLVDRILPSAQAATTQQAKPQTVIQNGHTYTLNPKTGQYE